MKIELKRFTTNARLSQETTAFAADVWVDDKRVGSAENAGHGGATIVRLDRTIRDQVEAHGKPLVPPEFKGFTGGAEWLVDQLVEAELQKKSDQAFAKKLARIDAKEKIAAAQKTLRSARLRCGDAWQWFMFKPDADPQVMAAAIATKQQVVVDELVVLS